MTKTLQVSDVFTPGRLPGITYNPRDQQNIEGELEDYLRTAGSALVISGPTKSGKTVLVRRKLDKESAVWLSGIDLRQVSDLWVHIIDFYQLYDEVSVQEQEMLGGTGRLSGKVGIPLIAGATLEGGATIQSTSTSSRSVSRPVAKIARDALRTVPVPIVIDDFHYVSDDLKTELTRTLKGIIEDTNVILIAVPQDAFDPVRAESDMVGRVRQLQIKPWTQDELVFIGQEGFRSLNLLDADHRLSTEFAANCLGAPFLMQQLCLEFCVTSGILEALQRPKEVSVPEDVLRFYAGVATRYMPAVFSDLRNGPKTKGQPRLTRHLTDGQETDIYGLILAAVSRMGPRVSIPVRDLMRSINQLCGNAPTAQQVTLALGHLQNIADKTKGSSDAALDYKQEVLHIADPFLSFYLRFGNWALPSAPDSL